MGAYTQKTCASSWYKTKAPTELYFTIINWSHQRTLSQQIE